ncbi:Tryptophan synthase alpha chain [Paraliobacillus sp. PM-2]|uniref:tryptophan synthase subunit alpha n=1 Tax=Paraliobacillus sp. PM-2 TaxID=1462524 RepID=UPI00061BA091|nr:tryptophan synthase subunit alpha [Paraliobacillus sp. PM-2]CQR46079.1 Tryptophan synthase alpha chain [Paraliobacillus sp. PM-2]
MPKGKLDHAFHQVLQKGDKAFVPYIMAGDGGLDQLNEQISFLEACGATAVEVGIPFSDPVADGPTIQKAGIRALKNHVTLEKVLDTLREAKPKRNIPIVVMSYINPIYAMGVKRFAAYCEQAGIDGLIIPDLPLEEEDIITKQLAIFQIALIRLAALTSTDHRMQEIINRTEGFLYAVTVTGTTGERAQFKENLAAHLKMLQEKSAVPVLAGFGVSTPEQVKELAVNCDGVIVGSRIVDLLHDKNYDAIQELIAAARQ